ncbi:hypothetical protein [Deinococcus marmoris]|uniref:hypothetical protein n=1 Tax=Deinococcus marmoris TaxID=249408 RepID=UPI0004965E09|nr:hypothetical protein [Deinococcus marmoris]
MSRQESFQYGLVVQLRLMALEKRWGTPSGEILALALQACQGVHSELNATLKGWMYPTPQALLQEGERLFGGGGWTMRRATDD